VKTFISLNKLLEWSDTFSDLVTVCLNEYCTSIDTCMLDTSISRQKMYVIFCKATLFRVLKV
jgi:hypothetical protein